MTTLSIRKADKAELQAHIGGEIAAYAIRLEGLDHDYSAEPDVRGNYPRKHFLGAVTEIVEATAVRALQELDAKLGEGYKLFIDGSRLPEVTPYYSKFYVVKSEAVQAEDIKALTKEVTAKYEQEIEDHNDRVFTQELEALKAEEAAIAAQIKGEDAARAASDLERRVRERMRGSRQAKPAKQEEGAE